MAYKKAVNWKRNRMSKEDRETAWALRYATGGWGGNPYDDMAGEMTEEANAEGGGLHKDKPEGVDAQEGNAEKKEEGASEGETAESTEEAPAAEEGAEEPKEEPAAEETASAEPEAEDAAPAEEASIA